MFSFYYKHYKDFFKLNNFDQLSFIKTLFTSQ